MKKISIKSITKMAIFLSILLMLEFLESSFLRMPQGGGLSIASLFFLIIIRFLSWKESCIPFLLLRIFILAILPPVIISPVQFLLDYFIAYLGFLMAYIVHKNNRISMILVSIISANILRYVIHVLTGVMYFAEYAQGPVVQYSILYNLSYMVPTLVCQIILSISMFPIVRKIEEKEKKNSGDYS